MGTDPILVTGATGTLGREVVRSLLERGQAVRVATRRPAPSGPLPYEWATVDYRRGRGMDDAVDGAAAVVHCATDVRGGEVRLARSVLAAMRRTGCPHFVYVSIVGIDRIPLSYYRSKLEAERAVAESGIGWTVLRSTQFHDLTLRLVGALTAPPLAVVPDDVRLQPVHAAEVADRLAGLAAGEPQRRVADLGGPEIHELPELTRLYLEARGRHRRTVPVRVPGRIATALREGHNLTPEHAEGRLSFAEFLAQRF
ncbi:SDR family oxidoreductase [Prauserella oleivorans]|uniref:SDR family oxidoreductase n=1 Tax=Prauserella oleivorans TaxID=1478153 RepID=A0ABW5WGE3_9PSEU